MIWLRMLAPAAFVGTFNIATRWVYVSTGRVDRQARWTAFAAGTRIVALLIGAHWGVWGVAASISVTTIALRYPQIVYCFKTAPVQPGDLFAVLWRPTLASLVAGIVLQLIQAQVALPDAPLLILGIDVAAFSSGYLLAWLLLPGGIPILRENLSLFRELRGGALQPRADS